MPNSQDDAETLFYLALGPMAAILLGAVLVPIRGFTTASNFAFVFMALTIAVAELGGRWAAVATALVSGLSLDFFLTEPYMRLTIAAKHDVIAVVGLTVCGLIAAAFGQRRGRKEAALSVARRHLDLLRAAVQPGEPGAAVETRFPEILRMVPETLPVAAAVVREEGGRMLAASDAAAERRGVPAAALPVWPASIPEEGARIALVCGGRRLGWLDVWGSGLPATAESHRTLTDVARSLALLLAACRDDTARP